MMDVTKIGLSGVLAISDIGLYSQLVSINISCNQGSQHEPYIIKYFPPVSYFCSLVRKFGIVNWKVDQVQVYVMGQ